MSGVETALLVAIGTIAFLDRWPVAQTMVSRPLVVGTAVGVVLGDPVGGALWGAIFEAMYLALLPVGASRLPDAGLAALAGTVVALSGETAEVYPAALAGTVGWLTGHLGEAADRMQRRWNGVLAAWGRTEAEKGSLRSPGRALVAALLGATALGAAASGIAVLGARGAVWWLGASPWGGPLGAGTLQLLVAASLTVMGTRAFLRRDGSRVGWGAGALAAMFVVWGLG